MKFSISKKGYDIAEVNDYLSKLEFDYKNKLDELVFKNNELKEKLAEQDKVILSYSAKSNNINEALVAAVETAKQIENSSRQIYKLEIKRLRILYNKWESFLQEMITRYPQLKGEFDSKILLDAFNQSIEKALQNNVRSIASYANDSPQEQVKSLLNKMSPRSFSEPIRQVKDQNIVCDDGEMPKELEKGTIVRAAKPSQKTLEELRIDDIYDKEEKRINNSIKPISGVKLENGDEYENVVDKFLDSSENDEKSAYEKALIKSDDSNKESMPDEKEKGFDLIEAITPTDDLLSIMKDFDLD